MLRYLTTLLLLAGISFSVYAQDLINSRQSSYYTFIYKITDDEAKEIYRDDYPVFKDSYFHTLVDFYPTDSVIYKRSLSIGHYLTVKSVEEQLEFTIHSVDNITMKLLNNHRDMMMVFFDSAGREINKNIQVKIKNKNIHYSNKHQAFVLERSNRKGLVQIKHNQHTSFFTIERNHNNGFFVRSGKTILSTFPINHIISPVTYSIQTVKNVIHGNHIYPPGIYYRTKRLFNHSAKKTTGYMTFNKPMYKPGDTVKLKAYVTTLKGKPLSIKKVTINLYASSSGYKYKNLGPATSPSKGSYVFDFVLHDSLKLSLDQSLHCYLENKSRKTLMQGSVRYEDYELKQNTYTIRSQVDQPNQAPVIYLKGTDSNDLPLFDVEATILITPKTIDDYFQQNVFVPDTLWSHTVELDPLGETKVMVPDSIFPSISFEYQVQASFRNAENELHTKELSLRYNRKAFPVKLNLSHDSLSISWNAGSELDELVSITAVNGDDSLWHQQVSLPFQQPIIPLASHYIITAKDQTKEFDLSEFQSLVSPISRRTPDSLFVTIDNPRNLMIRYQLFHGNNLIEKSSGTAIHLARKANSTSTYSFAMQYIWGGKSIENNYTITLNTRELDIQIEHPKEIYPGQEAEFTVSVTDYKNNPVAHADLTAYAITKKFPHSGAASVPSFFKPKSGRKIFNKFSEQQSPPVHNQLMDFPFWRKQMGLDSITFYKFLYPDNGYFIHYSPTEENITQFAPFVIRKGIILPISVIYVDNVVVFYRKASAQQPYTFPISPGEHTIRLRLANKEITLHNINAVGGQKLILSIDPEREIPFVETIKKPNEFTKEELNKLQRYFVFANYNQYAPSYLSQANRFYMLNVNRSSELMGPFNPGTVTFAAKDNTSSFYYEPNYDYTFDKGLIKMKASNIRKSLTGKLYYYNGNTPSLNSQMLTLCHLEEYWKSLETKRIIQFNKYVNGPMTSTGRLLITENNSLKHRLLQGIYAINLDNPDQYYLFPNTYNLLNEIQYGHYQIVLIYDNNEYISADSIDIKPHGINYYNFQDYPVHAPDSFSNKILSTLELWGNNSYYSEYNRSREAQAIRGLYYDKQKDKNPYVHLVSGQITNNGEPIPGVSILVKGTTFGTSTDIDGYYEIRCPSDATLIFSFIGHITEERRVNALDQIDVILEEDISRLEEVVVVGYGTQRKQSLYYSVTTVENSLMGRMAEVSVPGASIRIRGASSLEGQGSPIFIVDGVIVDLDTIDPNSITAMQVLNETNATAIYGSRAANGAVIISTRPGMTDDKLLESLPQMPSIIPLDGNVPGSSLRNNFRDYGFWKPTLYTDENGKATFKATFPDDITGWNIYVLGMANKKRSGQTQSQIQSYKPLIAQLALPHFLIAGDSSYAVGKLTNYSKDTIEVKNDLAINDQLQYSRNVKFLNSHIDSILLNGTNSDSIKVTYRINYKGYQDGEQRTIPVKPQGTEETIGVFAALPNDTSFVVNFSDSLGNVTLYAQADLLDVLYEEINYLKYYAYECNEQLASKLRALLAKKKMDEFRGEKFESEKEVNKIIKKLVNNQNQQGGWGWWNQSKSNVWTTIHVGEALELAKNSNIEFRYDRELMIQNLFSLYIETSSTDRLRCMIFLTQLGEPIDAKNEVAALLKNKEITNYDKLLAQRLLSLTGTAPDYDWINQNKHETLKGNYYWGEEVNHLLNNDITNTLLAYSILEKRNPDDPALVHIRNYFLEKRKQHWRNTYESSLIVKTILPGLIKNQNKETKTSISIKGNGINKTITTFPFEMELGKPTPLTISKQGTSPIYFTAYQEIWNSSPTRVDKDFEVSTSFENHTNDLEAGKPVTLKVDVTVKKDAEYVMIQIPIPAGCSYESKKNGYGQGEVHREYYLHQTNIYAQSLKQGHYTYTLKLVPRYKGTYHLNPATIEWMYFPTVFGREAMKKIKIK